jgi:tetratricopeptide (TPR) repeat protein
VLRGKNQHGWQRTFGVASVLALITIVAFFGVWNNDFVDYDDNVYVFLNPHVVRGLDWETVKWAFTFIGVAHWVPLTWLSYALDSEVYGMNPGGFHVTNLAFHVANTILVFLLLRRITGSLWRGALVAALFAVHPLHVQSVAWVAERKDVLSGFFFLLMLFAYAVFVERKRAQELHEAERLGSLPEAAFGGGEMACRESRRQQERGGKLPETTVWYGLAILCFILGLMSKSMLVTGPFVMLLLDLWPLGRLRWVDARLQKGSEGICSMLRTLMLAFWPLVREKTAFFVLAGISSVITFLAGEQEVRDIGTMPLATRLANGSIAFVSYLQQTFWPVRLAVFYPPRPLQLLDWETIGAIGFLALLTVGVLYAARKSPLAFVGWFWFLGMLVPVSGIVQVGEMVQADRYMYLPSIGLSILIVWGVAGMLSRLLGSRRSRQILIPFSAVVLGLLMVGAHRQVRIWRNTRTLFSEAARVTQGNYQALSSLADLDLKEGHTAEAMATLEQLLQIAPRYPRAEYLMGTVLQMTGKMQEAMPHLRFAVGPEVGTPGQARMVLSLLDAGRLAEAEDALARVLQAIPGEPNGLLMRAALFREQGRVDEARQLFESLMARKPQFILDNPTIHFELAELYSLAGDGRAVSSHYEAALRLAPNTVKVLNNYAWLLATDPRDSLRDGRKAVELAERGCRLTEWREPVVAGTLAAAYAEAGRFDDAIKTGEKARDIARGCHAEDLARRNGELLELYRQHKPYRETSG